MAAEVRFNVLINAFANIRAFSVLTPAVWLINVFEISPVYLVVLVATVFVMWFPDLKLMIKIGIGEWGILAA